MNWYELKAACINDVARDLARGEASRAPEAERMKVWAEEQRLREPDAIRAINEMSNVSLLDLISKVMGARQ